MCVLIFLSVSLFIRVKQSTRVTQWTVSRRGGHPIACGNSMASNRGEEGFNI